MKTSSNCAGTIRTMLTSPPSAGMELIRRAITTVLSPGDTRKCKRGLDTGNGADCRCRAGWEHRAHRGLGWPEPEE